jgi:hypothetical protein
MAAVPCRFMAVISQTSDRYEIDFFLFPVAEFHHLIKLNYKMTQSYLCIAKLPTIYAIIRS